MAAQAWKGGSTSSSVLALWTSCNILAKLAQLHSLKVVIYPWYLQALRPRLNEEQKAQLEECFELMDADGSGAIDADELGAAFKVTKHR